MSKKIYNHKILGITILFSLFVTSCQQYDDFEIIKGEEGYITLNLSPSDMLPTYIDPMEDVLGTRAATQKSEDEKQINSLHLFFFDENTTNVDGKDVHKLVTFSNTDAKPYIQFYNVGESNKSIKIEKSWFTTGQKVKVVALANIQGKNGSENAIFKTDPNQSVGNFIQTLVTSEENSREGKFETEPAVITCLEDLHKWIYAPKERERVRDLPEGGMPMISEEKTITIQETSLQTISMKSMMARVEVNITLEPNQTSRLGDLPILNIKSYGVNNMPSTVAYTQPGTENADEDYTDITYGNFRTDKTIDENHSIAADSPVGRDKISLVYYVYENIRGTYEKSEDFYPEGVDTEVEKQRWKPIVAKEEDLTDKATQIIINGEYVTHQNITYQAKFTVYLGGNTTDDFNVKRNHCYTNNIVIHGLDYVRNEDNGEYTFDGRVNVKDQNNPWYISIVNERKVDAHASVLPMDIYLVLREDVDNLDHPEWSEVNIEIIDDNTGKLCDWIGFEMIDYPSTMIPNRTINNYGKEAFVAGTGCKPYFIYDMVTKDQLGTGQDYTPQNFPEGIDPKYGGQNEYDLRKKGTYRIQENVGGNSSSYIVNGKEVFNTKDYDGKDEHIRGGHIAGAYSRMRIYFYIDENVPQGLGTNVTKDNVMAPSFDRHASVKLTYNNSEYVKNNIPPRERTVEIDQKGLLLVAAKHGKHDDWTYMYIETYEEYLEHSDPLEYHTSPEVFQGLQWGPTNPGNGGLGRVSNATYGVIFQLPCVPNSYENYHHGLDGTKKAINGNGNGNGLSLDMRYVRLYNDPNAYKDWKRDKINPLDKDNLKLYALNYCYGKNKRNDDGSVYEGNDAPGFWELPGIRDLEVALVQYYDVFPEFQSNFYWSSAEGINNGRAVSDRARSTQVTYKNGYTYAESNYGKEVQNQWDSGSKERKDNTVRIRAAYKTRAQENRKSLTNNYNLGTGEYEVRWPQIN